LALPDLITAMLMPEPKGKARCQTHMKQIMLVALLATAASAFARLGDTQKEFEQANPDFKYVGDGQLSGKPTVKVQARQYQRDDGKVAIITFGPDGKAQMEVYSDLSGKFTESSLAPVAKSYGYEFSALQKQSVPGTWNGLVMQKDFWFSADHKFCIGIQDVLMNDSKPVSTMVVYGEQGAPNIYEDLTKKTGSEEPWWKMPGMMNIFKFILLLLFLGFALTWIYPFLIAPLLGLLALPFRKNPEKRNVWVYLVMAIIFASNVYLLSGWAAYIAHLSHSWSAAPEVTQHWLYFVVGFFGCVVPLLSMGDGAHERWRVDSLLSDFYCLYPFLYLACRSHNVIRLASGGR
jgi:hypothetical protein